MNAITVELKRSTALSTGQTFRSHDRTMSVRVPNVVDEFLGYPEFVTVSVTARQGVRIENPDIDIDPNLLDIPPLPPQGLR